MEKTFSFLVPKPVWRTGPVLELKSGAPAPAAEAPAATEAAPSSKTEDGEFDLSNWLEYVSQTSNDQ